MVSSRKCESKFCWYFFCFSLIYFNNNKLSLYSSFWQLKERKEVELIIRNNGKKSGMFRRHFYFSLIFLDNNWLIFFFRNSNSELTVAGNFMNSCFLSFACSIWLFCFCFHPLDPSYFLDLYSKFFLFYFTYFIYIFCHYWLHSL